LPYLKPNTSNLKPDYMGSDQIVLIKYGGNAMRDEAMQEEVARRIKDLKEAGFRPVLVHGGGPFIKQMLELAGIKSEFIDGHRKTTEEALPFIEMALKGQVNGQMVRLLNKTDVKAVGLSGKDGRFITAEKRTHVTQENGQEIHHDLGRVGDVVKVDPRIIHSLLDGGYVPVVTCIASSEDGDDYNINGDMLAGHLAGALNAYQYLVLTDVDGLYKDINDPKSLIEKLTLDDVPELYGGIIKGGMIPKLDSCRIALAEGAKTAAIINGMKPERIVKAAKGEDVPGTFITK